MVAVPARTAYCLRGLTPWAVRAFAFKDTRGRRYCIYHGKLYAGPIYRRCNKEIEIVHKAICLGAFGSGFSVGGDPHKMYCDIAGFEYLWHIVSEHNCTNCIHYAYEDEDECGQEGGCYYCDAEKTCFCELNEPHEMKEFCCRYYEHDGSPYEVLMKYVKKDEKTGFKGKYWGIDVMPCEDGKCMRANRDLEESFYQERNDDWPVQARR